MANIHDIAHASGYSVSTVSRVINHRKYVTDDVRQKVEQVMRDLDYVPNAVARDLSMGNTHNIGVVVPHSQHPYFTQITDGIMEAAFAAGYRMVLLPSKYDERVERHYLEQLRQRAFDAIIFTSRALPLKELAEDDAHAANGRIVCCENPGDLPLAAAYTERDETYKTAFKWIKARGYKRIGLLLSREYALSATSQSMIEAYKDVFGTLPLSELIRTGVVNNQDGYDSAQYYIDHALQPDFIFGNGDDIVANARQCYVDHGLTVPGLMGQEHQLSSTLLQLPTIDHHFNELGRNAFALAISDQVEQRPVTSTFIDPERLTDRVNK